MADGAIAWWRAGARSARLVVPLPEVLDSPEGQAFARSVVDLDLRAGILAEVLRRAAAHDAGIPPGPVPASLEQLARELDELEQMNPSTEGAGHAQGSEGTPIERTREVGGGRESVAEDRQAKAGAVAVPSLAPEGAPQPTTEKEKTSMRESTYTWKGETKTLKEWAAVVGMSREGVRFRIKKGLNPDGSPADADPPRAAARARTGRRPPRKPAPERVEVRELARVNVPALLISLGLEVRVMEGTLEGWQVLGWRAERA